MYVLGPKNEKSELDIVIFLTCNKLYSKLLRQKLLYKFC
jgi:hypothetical protein